MTQGGGDGDDPFELDPFGGSEYDPTRAFAHIALTRTRKLVEQADAHVAQELHAYRERSNQIARSARKSMKIYQEDLHLLLNEAQQSFESPDGIDDTIQAFHEAKGVHEQLFEVSAKIRTEDPVLATTVKEQMDPASLLDPRPASKKVLGELRSFLSGHWGNASGSTVVTKATPGVGKTYAMLQTAHERYLAGGRVAFAARTKEMIDRPDAELVQRVTRRSPAGKIHLAVIHGRDEKNCLKHEAVEAVMAHGYAPFIAVCKRCEYYPGNSQMFGLGICKYYEDRIAADLAAKAARQGRSRYYPFVLTTHASVVAASQISGGQHGSFWNVEGIYFDEDPTDAIEVDITLTEQHTEFQSASADTASAGIIAQLYREAFAIAKRERSLAMSNGFKAPGSDEFNSHPVHSNYDSAYVGEDLFRILEEARQRIASTIAVETLKHMFRSVSDGRGFHVDTGALADVDGTEDINALDVPPKTLADVAGAVHQEMNHAMALQRLIYAETHNGAPPVAGNLRELFQQLEEHTDLGDMSYHVRLECLPLDIEKGRMKDEWRFVISDKRGLENRTATLIIGDAYAHQNHYEQLLERPVSMIDVTSELHPDARFLRVVDDQCNISNLRRGGLQRVLALAEAQITEMARPEERVLVYTHMEMVPQVEMWLEEIGYRLELRSWAVEHWWGGRGKDQYNGWEHTLCLSDPVLSLSGMKHVANGRAWRDSVRASTLDEKLLHATRCELGDGRHGAIHALRSAHPRIALEHDRMNISEMTQALHRSRPAHNPVTITMYGGMEQNAETLAQVVTFMHPESQKVTSANRRAKKRTKQQIVTVDEFITEAEAEAAIRAIIAHYGVWSSWFAHALQAVMSQTRGDSVLDTPFMKGVGSETHSGHPVTGQVSEKTQGSQLVEPNSRDLDTRWDPWSSFKRDQETRDPTRYHGKDKTGLVPKQRARARRSGARPGATEPARWAGAKPLPNPVTLIERVWHPPAHWRQLTYVRTMPKKIRAAHAAVLDEAKQETGSLRSVKLERRPSWESARGGQKLMIVYDSSMLHFASALEHYMSIVETQYGNVRGHRLTRPKAIGPVPSSMSAVPF